MVGAATPHIRRVPRRKATLGLGAFGHRVGEECQDEPDQRRLYDKPGQLIQSLAQVRHPGETPCRTTEDLGEESLAAEQFDVAHALEGLLKRGQSLLVHRMRCRAQPFETRLDEEEQDDGGASHYYDRDGCAYRRHRHQQDQDTDRHHDLRSRAHERSEDRADHFQYGLMAVADEFRGVPVQVEGIGEAQVAPDQLDRQSCRRVVDDARHDVLGDHREDRAQQEKPDHDPDEDEEHRLLSGVAEYAAHVADQRHVDRPAGIRHKAQEDVHQSRGDHLQHTVYNRQHQEQEPARPPLSPADEVKCLADGCDQVGLSAPRRSSIRGSLATALQACRTERSSFCFFGTCSPSGSRASFASLRRPPSAISSGEMWKELAEIRMPSMKSWNLKSSPTKAGSIFAHTHGIPNE